MGPRGKTEFNIKLTYHISERAAKFHRDFDESCYIVIGSRGMIRKHA